MEVSKQPFCALKHQYLLNDFLKIKIPLIFNEHF
jgi:hypothetical protein